jgi:hypothetical protein
MFQLKLQEQRQGMSCNAMHEQFEFAGLAQRKCCVRQIDLKEAKKHNSKPQLS